MKTGDTEENQADKPGKTPANPGKTRSLVPRTPTSAQQMQMDDGVAALC